MSGFVSGRRIPTRVARSGRGRPEGALVPLAIVIAVALAASLILSSGLLGSDGRTGDESDPCMLIGSADGPLVMPPGSETTAVIAVNALSFHNPVLSVEMLVPNATGNTITLPAGGEGFVGWLIDNELHAAGTSFDLYRAESVFTAVYSGPARMAYEGIEGQVDATVGGEMTLATNGGDNFVGWVLDGKVYAGGAGFVPYRTESVFTALYSDGSAATVRYSDGETVSSTLGADIVLKPAPEGCAGWLLDCGDGTARFYPSGSSLILFGTDIALQAVGPGDAPKAWAALPLAYGGLDLSLGAGEDGVFPLTVKARADASGLADLRIRVRLTETVERTDADEIAAPRSVSADQCYHYRINVSIADEVPNAVVLSKDASGAPSLSRLELFYGTDTGDVYAFARTGDGDSASLAREGYSFYAVGLPDGIAMRADGVIEGKVSGDVVEETEGTFRVYAARSADPLSNGVEAICYGEFEYVLPPAPGSFRYSIDGGEPALYSVAGYAAVRSGGQVVVKVSNIDGSGVSESDGYTASASMDGGTWSAIDMVGDTATLPVPEEITGIIQLRIVKAGAFEAVIHVLAVGPLVHSGLAMTVTSA